MKGDYCPVLSDMTRKMLVNNYLVGIYFCLVVRYWTMRSVVTPNDCLIHGVVGRFLLGSLWRGIEIDRSV